MSICKIEDCGKPVHGRGMCSMHATRVRRHGSPDVVIHSRDNRKYGPDHHHWQERPSYLAAHARVRTARGPAKLYACVQCGGKARHWSYNYTDPTALTDERGYEYSADPQHYSPRCVPCHGQFDVDHREFPTAERPEDQCGHDGCIRVLYCRGLCYTHWRRQRMGVAS